jgi:dolichol-phosphate mannosyltransferase
MPSLSRSYIDTYVRYIHTCTCVTNNIYIYIYIYHHLVKERETKGLVDIAQGAFAGLQPTSRGEYVILLCVRQGKEGLGAAYLAGFAWALDAGYDVIVEMDADGSHQPEQLPDLLAALRDADLVLGSRWVTGGGVVNWPKSREVLSRGGNAYTRIMLGVPLRDATGGYRAFRASTLRSLELDEVASQGYCFQVDLAWRAVQRGMRVTEVPITFVERTAGTSKMSQRIVVEALWRVTVWGVDDKVARIRGKAARRSAAAKAT